MICGKDVNNIDVVPECLLVLLGDDHGSYLTPGVANTVEVILCEEQVMWAGLACHSLTLLLGCLDHQDLPSTQHSIYINANINKIKTHKIQ